MTHDRINVALPWLGTLVVIAFCLGPVWGDWSGTVVGPFGGIDALLQTGLLEWSAQTWWQPSRWVDLPIFYPVPGGIGFMDSLLGQAWLVWPAHLLFKPTAAALYNLAFFGSLVLAALGMGAVWVASGGSRRSAGVAALALVGAPYTLAQLGHLNQLPPPFVLFSLAAMLWGLRRLDEGRSAFACWCLLGLSLVLQAAWGWYGFAYAFVGVTVIKMVWLARRWRHPQRNQWVVKTVLQAALPGVLAIGAVWWLAQPQLNLGQRYDGFSRDSQEVRLGSADIQHLINRGVYRSGPADWIGQGARGLVRYQDQHRQVLNPGWLALGLALLGWWQRRNLASQQQLAGQALLVLGFVGLILSFGDSVGLPGTDRRLPLPLEWIRTIAPPFRAFRGAWRFSWLLVIAVSWWAAVGAGYLVRLQARSISRRLAPTLALVLLTLVSIPAAVPGLKVALDGHPLSSTAAWSGPILSLPAPINEYAEDQTEALWLLRALETGQQVTGGATGWVPPEIVELRQRMYACEQGQADVRAFFKEMQQAGVVAAEIVGRPGDDLRAEFWRKALADYGACANTPWPRQTYEMYRLP